MDKLRVPVECLVVGLYVCELDRPWLETPFLFQGFPIQTEEQIRVLGKYCCHVWVDSDQSELIALALVQSRSAPQLVYSRPRRAGWRMPPRQARETHTDTRDLFGVEAYPDTHAFRELLRVTRAMRQRCNRVVNDLLNQARFGRSIQTGEAEHLVRDMVSAIVENASASLWLTNLKRHDEYTSVHCMNVCVLAIAFGRHLGVERSLLELVGMGALLHDIGKMYTPDRILNKPGRLTPEEFEIIKRHPVEGYHVMRGTQGIPAISLDIIRFHHERISGLGYPKQLQGDEIGLPTLISALADVYDAMTSDRIYQRGIPPDRVLQSMLANASQDFGQELVEEFIRCLGIYPVGSLVELYSGAIGIVITSERYARLQPVVQLLRTPDGEAYEQPVVVNLAAMNEGSAGLGWNIRRSLNPKDVGIDVARIVDGMLEPDGATDFH